MKVWILEQDISRSENLERMIKRFLENAGAVSQISTFQMPGEVITALKQRKSKPAVLFVNPDSFDMKYSGLNLAHKIFEKKWISVLCWCQNPSDMRTMAMLFVRKDMCGMGKICRSSSITFSSGYITVIRWKWSNWSFL